MTRKNEPNDQISVLIVDDDPDTREMYAASLRAEGFHAREADSGEEALKLAAGAQPAVVVTDLRLGGSLDGFELTRRLRADNGDRLRIIMLSGASFGDEKREAEDAGCDRFLVKPCLPEDLASAIRSVVLTPSAPAPGAGRSAPPGGRAHR
jgi:CheY-like chemotaxis protein